MIIYSQAPPRRQLQYLRGFKVPSKEHENFVSSLRDDPHARKKKLPILQGTTESHIIRTSPQNGVLSRCSDAISNLIPKLSTSTIILFFAIPSSDSPLHPIHHLFLCAQIGTPTYSSIEKEGSFVSQHSDDRGVTITRAPYVRAPQLHGNLESPGPARYDVTPHRSPLTAGIKFSLARRPPGPFDVPASRIIPGPGQYGTGTASMVMKGQVQRSPRSPRRAQFLNGTAESQFPTAASARKRRTQLTNNDDENKLNLNAPNTWSRGQQQQLPGKVSDSDLNDSNLSSPDRQLDISSLSFISAASDSLNTTGSAVLSKPQRNDRYVPEALLRKIKARLNAAAYTKRGGWGQNRVDLFRSADKDRDGFLSFTEVQSFFRRILKLTQGEMSDRQLKLLFRSLDVTGAKKVSYEQFFVLAGREVAGGRPSSSIQQPLSQGQKQPTGAFQKKEPSLAAVATPNATREKESSNRDERLPIGVGDEPGGKKSAVLKEMLNDVQRLHVDFESQLQELQGFSNVLEELLQGL